MIILQKSENWALISCSTATVILGQVLNIVTCGSHTHTEVTANPANSQGNQGPQPDCCIQNQTHSLYSVLKNTGNTAKILKKNMH